MIFALVMAMAGQQQSQTTCRNVFGTLQCATQGTAAQSPAAQPYRAPQSYYPQQPSYEEKEALTQQSRSLAEQARALQIQNDRAELPGRVGNLVAKGKCEQAEQLALRFGEFDLAKKAKGYCATRQAEISRP